jgi:hypothetical protein
MDINSFILGFVKGRASGGGGSSDDVRYVTFINGAEELYVKPVATGDDCVDVLAKGLIGTPTKESTVDKVFTYSGWALTDGAAANANALKAVDEDRTVYAAYTSTARTYTITYYDSDGVTVLKTERIAYGSTPSYTPSKDGFDFVAWTPAPAEVTEDTSYVATWKTKATFETASWSEIASVCDAGNAKSTFALGDSRVETLTFADGTTEQITLVIVGFDERYVYDGKSRPAETSKLVLMTKNALSKKRQMHTYSVAWSNSSMYTYLNNDVYQALPNDLREVVKQCSVNVWPGYLAGTAAYVWTPNLSDLGTSKKDFACYESKLPFFADNASRIKKLGNNGAATTYWTSSTKSNNYAYITESGGVYGGENSNAGFAVANNEHGVVFGIII